MLIFPSILAIPGWMQYSLVDCLRDRFRQKWWHHSPDSLRSLFPRTTELKVIGKRGDPFKLCNRELS